MQIAACFGTLFLSLGDTMPRIMLLGDSTCAPKRPDARPETGWGEMLPRFVREGWTVDNRAINGLATKDMIARGILQEALDCISAGDIVLVQFGHNDSKAEDSSRYSAPWSEYIVNLVYIAGRIMARGAYPAIITPIARRRFSEGLIIDTHGDYPAAAKAAAHQSGCPCIDMTIPTMVALQAMGEEASKECFMHFDAGLYPDYPDGDEDDTHLRPRGAEWVASLIADRLNPLFPDAFLTASTKAD